MRRWSDGEMEGCVSAASEGENGIAAIEIPEQAWRSRRHGDRGARDGCLDGDGARLDAGQQNHQQHPTHHHPSQIRAIRVGGVVCVWGGTLDFVGGGRSSRERCC